MRFKVIQVGKTEDNYLAEGIEHYARRIRRYASFTEITLPGIRKGTPSSAELRELEGKNILRQVTSREYTIALDENGKPFSSREFATHLETITGRGISDITFLIGGAYGLSKEVISSANLVVSLSKMTFTHQMVRLIFAEQLYRAMSILKNSPYHH